jgi:hypothetical protein
VRVCGEVPASARLSCCTVPLEKRNNFFVVADSKRTANGGEEQNNLLRTYQSVGPSSSISTCHVVRLSRSYSQTRTTSPFEVLMMAVHVGDSVNTEWPMYPGPQFHSDPPDVQALRYPMLSGWCAGLLNTMSFCAFLSYMLQIFPPHCGVTAARTYLVPQSVSQSSRQTISQPVSQSISQPASQSVSQSASQPISQPVSQPVNQLSRVATSGLEVASSNGRLQGGRTRSPSRSRAHPSSCARTPTCLGCATA